MAGYCKLCSHVASVKQNNREDGDSVIINLMKPAKIFLNRFLILSQVAPESTVNMTDLSKAHL